MTETGLVTWAAMGDRPLRVGNTRSLSVRSGCVGLVVALQRCNESRGRVITRFRMRGMRPRIRSVVHGKAMRIRWASTLGSNTTLLTHLSYSKADQALALQCL